MATQRHARHALPSRSTWSILRTQFHKASLTVLQMPSPPVYVY